MQIIIEDRYMYCIIMMAHGGRRGDAPRARPVAKISGYYSCRSIKLFKLSESKIVLS